MQHLTQHVSILSRFWQCLILLFIWQGGCVQYKIEKSKRPETRHLEVRHEAHGTSYSTVVDEDLWYVTQGNRLLVLDPITGRQISETDLDRGGHSGPAVDMLVNSTDIYVVLRDTSVVSLDRTDPRRPWIETRWDASTLGISPRSIHHGASGPIICGLGGAVQLPDMNRLVDHHDEIMSVVEIDDDLIYATGRRVYRISDDRYIGSASTLESFSNNGKKESKDARGVVLPSNVVLFTRNESTGGLAGFASLEDDLLREVDSAHMTEVFSGEIQQIHGRGDRVLIVTGDSIHLYRMNHKGHLIEYWSQQIKGARDAGFIDEDGLVVVGEFGQAMFRTDRQIDSITYRHDSPGGLLQAISDGRSIVATGVDGTWKYVIGDKAELVTDQIRLFAPAPRSVAMLGWEVSISEDGTKAIFKNEFGESSLDAPVGSLFTTVTAAEGNFWLGHHEGILMLTPPTLSLPAPAGWEKMDEAERLATGYTPLQGMKKLSVKIDGPVIFLQPLNLGGGVAYAAVNDGFGVVRESW